MIVAIHAKNGFALQRVEMSELSLARGCVGSGVHLISARVLHASQSRRGVSIRLLIQRSDGEVSNWPGQVREKISQVLKRCTKLRGFGAPQFVLFLF